MKVYKIEDIIRKLNQDEMTEYLERFQFNKTPVWEEWLNSQDVYHIKYESGDDDKVFEDDIKIIGIPLQIVDMLTHMDFLKFMNNHPLTLERTRLDNEEAINKLKNEIWGLSYRYNYKGYGKNDIYVYWVWSNGYFIGIFRGKKLSIFNN